MFQKRTNDEQMRRYEHMLVTAERQLMAAVTIGDDRRAIRATRLIGAIVQRIKAELDASETGNATRH